jgi:hypothetical protein
VKLSEYKALKKYIGFKVYRMNGELVYFLDFWKYCKKEQILDVYNSYGFKKYLLQIEKDKLKTEIFNIIRADKILNFINKLFRIVK